MGPETPEILRKNSEQPLVPGSPLHSLRAAASTAHRPDRAALSTAAVSQRFLNPHTRCQPAPLCRAGPAGAPRLGAWAGSRRPPLRPLPGAAPAARPAAPARAPHAGPAVPGRSTSSPRASISCPAAEPLTPAIRPLPDTQRATTRPRCPCPAPRRRAGPRRAPSGRSPWWGLCGPLPSRLGRTLRAAAAALPPAAAAPGSSRALPPPSPVHAQCGEPGALTGGGLGPRSPGAAAANGGRPSLGAEVVADTRGASARARKGREGRGKVPPSLLEDTTGWAWRGCGGGRRAPSGSSSRTCCSVRKTP